MTKPKTQHLPGWGLKTASKILVILSIILTALGAVGGGASGIAAVGFFSFLFLFIPAIILYLSGRRVQKNAIKKMVQQQQNDIT